MQPANPPVLLPAELEYHAGMLTDRVRLALYKAALEVCLELGTEVVEIGYGTGILLAYAARYTQSYVTGIESSDRLWKVAEYLRERSGVSDVRLLHGRSYDVTLDSTPDLLYTETLGPLGLEERIVPACLDFVRRHPTIKHVIPNSVTVLVQPIRSAYVTEGARTLIERLQECTGDALNPDALSAVIESSLSTRFRVMTISDAEAVDPPVPIATYRLGVDGPADIHHTLHLPDHDEFDALHLFFEADLAPGIVLSTHISEPLTCWEHVIVHKPSQTRNTVTIHFDWRLSSFTFDWSGE